MKKNRTFSYSLGIDGVSYECIIKFFESMKSLKIKINNDLQILIHVPPNTPSYVIEKFVQLNLDNIKKIINKKNSSKFYNPKNNIISLYGKEHSIIVENHDSNDKYVIGYKTITLYLKDLENKTKLIRKLFKNESKKYIVPRAKEIAQHYGLVINKINIKWMTSCWGNCRKSLKLINFSSRLITFPKEIIDYVIVHELCHLIEANHSKKFWDLIAKIYPNYKQAREYLKNF